MIPPTHPAQPMQAVEQALRQELGQGGAVIATAAPILRHLLANDEHALFSDQVVARVRGMVASCARAALMALAEQAGIVDRGGFADQHEAALAAPLIGDAGFLAHAHALTIETGVTERLAARSGIDPVLTPLVQELAASANPATAALAMEVLAAQARFMQQQHRMHLPLAELPADLLHLLLQQLADLDAATAPARAAAAAQLRQSFDEGRRRVNLMARLLLAMERQAARALAVDHAGVAIFASALAMASQQERDTAVFTLVENQFARLALALRAGGVDQAGVEQQFLILHPDVTLPDGFEMITAARARDLLAEPHG